MEEPARKMRHSIYPQHERALSSNPSQKAISIRYSDVRLWHHPADCLSFLPELQNLPRTIKTKKGKKIAKDMASITSTFYPIYNFYFSSFSLSLWDERGSNKGFQIQSGKLGRGVKWELKKQQTFNIQIWDTFCRAEKTERRISSSAFRFFLIECSFCILAHWNGITGNHASNILQIIFSLGRATAETVIHGLLRAAVCIRSQDRTFVI